MPPFSTVLVFERGKDATRLVANPALPLLVVGGAKAYHVYKNSSREPGGSTVIHADLEAMVAPRVDPVVSVLNIGEVLAIYFSDAAVYPPLSHDGTYYQRTNC